MPNEKVKKILSLHKKLVTRYKEYETTDGDVPPTVVLNEMRYALRATMKLLNQASFEHLEDKDLDNFNTAAQEAQHALRNAYHDLVDGILIQISLMMDKLLEVYPAATVAILGSRRLEILEDLNEVEKSVAKSRGDGINRDKLYDIEIYDKWFLKIVEHYKFVDQVALFEIIKEDERLKEEKKTELRKYTLSVLLTILGITYI